MFLGYFGSKLIYYNCNRTTSLCQSDVTGHTWLLFYIVNIFPLLRSDSAELKSERHFYWKASDKGGRGEGCDSERHRRTNQKHQPLSVEENREGWCLCQARVREETKRNNKNPIFKHKAHKAPSLNWDGCGSTGRATRPMIKVLEIWIPASTVRISLGTTPEKTKTTLLPVGLKAEAFHATAAL